MGFFSLNTGNQIQTIVCWIFLVIVILFVLGILLAGGFFVANKILKKAPWYKSLFIPNIDETYPTVKWEMSHDERNFDVVNIGSSVGKYAFDYSDKSLNIKGLNFAQQPQGFENDFRLLKKFHSILRQNGTVIMIVCPLSSVAYKKETVISTLKYIQIFDSSLLDSRYYTKARRLAKYPILMGKFTIKILIKYIIKSILRLNKVDKVPDSQLDYNPMNEEQLEEDALKWVNGWKKEFNIKDFSDPLTLENVDGMKKQIPRLQEMIDFCTERSYKSVIIVPPVTNHLAKYFTPTFRENYIYDFIHEVNRKVQVLDYMDDETLKSDDLYFNSFFFNSKGRKIFTGRVLTDLDIIKKE